MTGETSGVPGQRPKRSPFLFLALVYLLTIPFWLLSTRLKIAGLPDNLPVTDVGATFMPMLAAVILIHREEGRLGVRRLLARTLDFNKIKSKIWWLPILLLLPVLYVVTWLVMRAFGLPVGGAWTVPLMTPLLFAVFFIAAAGEELGYTAYATDPLQARFGALGAALFIGPVWALWHLPSMIQIGQTPMLIVWGLAGTIAIRVLYVWLYNNSGGSVFAVIAFHAMGNTGRSIFPGERAAYELSNGAVGYGLLIIAAIAVTLCWGPKTLANLDWRQMR
jgi:uncharacterized protein